MNLRATMPLTLPALLALAAALSIARADDAAPRPAPATRPTTQPADDFTQSLLGGRSTDHPPTDKSIAAMREAEQRLQTDHDPGPHTQDAQRRALAALDDLVNMSQQGQGSRGPGRAASGERRRAGRAAPPKPTTTADAARAEAKAAKNAATRAGPGTDRRGIGSASADVARGWGYLPSRDRDELMQGLDEQFPAKYREQIERYYRSLAEEPPP